MKWLLFALSIVGLVADASACNRCGYSVCKIQRVYYPPAIQKVFVPYEKKVYVPSQSNVYVVQNSYPTPLVAQGTSNVVASTASYQQSVLPFLEPNQYFSQELQLIKAATQTNALRVERSANLFQRVMELQAPAVERMAAGQAAAQVLQAAGLDPAYNKSGSSSAVVVSNIQGKVQVTPLNQDQLQHLNGQLPPPANGGPVPYQNGQGQPPPQNGYPPQNGHGPPHPQAPPPGHDTQIDRDIPPPMGPPQPDANVKYPLFGKFCAKCHGLQVSQPKGEFFMGEDVNVARVMRARWFDITSRVTRPGEGQMPPPDQPQPTQEEKAAILNELEAMINASSQGG